MMVDSLPLRLHRAVSILSRSNDPGAADAQSACAEVAARIILLEEALSESRQSVEDAIDRCPAVC